MQKKPTTKAKLTDSRASETKPVSAPNQTIQNTQTLPSHDQIARRAYEIFVGRGQVAGRELEDWVQAERELFERAHRRN